MPVPAQVDFYIPASDGRHAHAALVCKLAQKAFDSGKSVFVLAGSALQAAELDRLMWTYDDAAFLPHARQDAADHHDRVLIGHDPESPADLDILINLSHPVPACYTRFTRVIEIVAVDADARQQSRQRFGTYRDAGCNPDSHDLKK